VNIKEDEVSKLSVKVNELERQSEKYLARLGDARCEIDQLNCEINQTRSSYDSSVDLLSKELRETRMKLEKTQSRENEVIQKAF
jgi:septation ring formation regulator EzrA